MTPVTATVRPAVTETSLTKKSKLPAVDPDPKVKCLAVLSKSMKMPPLSVEVTIPERCRSPAHFPVSSPAAP
jgi:hypothetical protein